VFDVADRSHRFKPWEPVVTERRRHVKSAGDWLPGATSVLVFGLRLHDEVLGRALQPPAESVGPYAFQTYVTNWLGSVIGYRLVRQLNELGYNAVLTNDVTGTESFTASPRGPQPDLFSNRFAGIAAGLGYLTVSGHLATPEFGLRQRCLAIVTDAPLTPSSLRDPRAGGNRCEACAAPCVSSCPSQAITAQRIDITCEGRHFAFNRIDARRCDWVKRYALMGESGFKYLGSPLDVAPPATITADALADAVRGHDPIKKYRPVVAEPCVIHCPLATRAGARVGSACGG
jgi:epoxyqueuosine reductase QueG